MRAEIYMGLSALCFSLQNVLVRLTPRTLDLPLILSFRGVFGCLLLLCTLPPIIGKNPRWLILRGILGSVTIITGFIAVLFIPMVLFSLLFSLSILWTGLLKREWRRYDLLSIGLCLGGIGMSIVPSLRHHSLYMNHTLIGVAMALVASFSSSIVNLILFRIKDEDPRTITMQNMFCIALLPLPGLWVEPHHHHHPIIIPWTYLIATALMTVLSQLSKNYSLQQSRSVRVIFLRFLDPLLSLGWDVFLFHLEWDPFLIASLCLLTAGFVLRLVSSVTEPALPVLLPDEDRVTEHVVDLPEVRDDKDPLEIGF